MIEHLLGCTNIRLIFHFSRILKTVSYLLLAKTAGNGRHRPVLVLAGLKDSAANG
jgi:hypothetical protein